MNRKHYFDCIVSKLSALATEIEIRGKLNYLDLHVHSENFYMHFFNELFGWKLQNLNTFKQNAESIDLIDHNNKIVIQVSATATKKKVESALTKDLSTYAGYAFKFISIAKDASSLRSKTFTHPHQLKFVPKNDIYDIPSILKYIGSLSAIDQRRIAAFIKTELCTEVDPQKIETNLATIINIFAKEEWDWNDTAVETIPFKIDDKIDHNNIVDARVVIDDYKVHYNRVDKMYGEFDKIGNSKSRSVLDAMRGVYLAQKNQSSGDALFFDIVELVAGKIQKSANYVAIPIEELDLCVNILVVDAFIRCKIFNNPIGYADAAS
ncbi:MAG: ABC-three component system protein [Geobacteraceae bacterium]|nr:ABC-three component system protein [Geobacteraceae bacterium]